MPKVKDLAAEVSTLKAKSLRAKVDGYLSKAKRSGRITEAQVAALRAQGAKDPRWLKGYLATLPKVLRGTGEEFRPRTDAQGNPVSTLTADQERIRNAMTAGLSAAERSEFDKTQAEIAARLPSNNMPRS
jgi:phage I-like protein